MMKRLFKLVLVEGVCQRLEGSALLFQLDPPIMATERTAVLYR
jgi:hypothetical protein